MHPPRPLALLLSKLGPHVRLAASLTPRQPVLQLPSLDRTRLPAVASLHFGIARSARRERAMLSSGVDKPHRPLHSEKAKGMSAELRRLAA